jgi:hypothetical protein
VVGLAAALVVAAALGMGLVSWRPVEIETGRPRQRGPSPLFVS